MSTKGTANWTDEEYGRYLNRLANLVYSELVPKVAMLDFFTEHVSEFKTPPEEVEPLLWFVRSGLQYDVTFSLYRLVYNRQSDRNIIHFLKVTDGSFDQIKWVETFEKSAIAEHLSDWEARDELVSRLVKRRNKFFAHYDEEFFYDPDILTEVYPFSMEDTKTLTRQLQNTIHFYCRRHSGSMPISMEGFVHGATYRLFENLIKVHEQRLADRAIA